MADKEQKAARGSHAKTMYGKGPRIEDKDVTATIKEGGAPEPKKTASAGEGDMKRGGDAKADVMAGTDGIPTMHQHSAERTEVHHRHMREHTELHGRHEREHMMRAMGKHHESHEEMNARHHEERRTMHTRHESEFKMLGARHVGTGPTDGIEDQSEGKAGTEKQD